MKKTALKIWKLQIFSVSLQKIVRRSAIRKQAFIALAGIIFAVQNKNIKRMKQVEERYISLLTDKVFDRLFEEAEIAKFTPQEMREYETSKMAYRDIKNSVDTAKREGIAEGKEIGMKEGMEKGRAEGMNQRSLDIARNMLADGVDINLIMKYSGLTQEQIEKLK